jgi:hypothetical protein
VAQDDIFPSDILLENLGHKSLAKKSKTDSSGTFREICLENFGNFQYLADVNNGGVKEPVKAPHVARELG